MNKLIQSIIISAVVIAPLSSLGLIADATMHHTESHVSTMSLETARTRRKTKKVKKVKKISTQANIKAKKQVAKRYQKKVVSTDKKSSSPEAMTPTPVEKSSQPVTPQTIPVPQSLPTPSTSPESSAPTPPLNSTLDPKSGNPIVNSSRQMTLPNPAAGTPNIPVFSPGSIANPRGDTSITNPKLPNVLPTGLVK
jgi:hypothetical protein